MALARRILAVLLHFFNKKSFSDKLSHGQWACRDELTHSKLFITGYEHRDGQRRFLAFHWHFVGREQSLFEGDVAIVLI